MPSKCGHHGEEAQGAVRSTVSRYRPTARTPVVLRWNTPAPGRSGNSKASHVHWRQLLSIQSAKNRLFALGINAQISLRTAGRFWPLVAQDFVWLGNAGCPHPIRNKIHEIACLPGNVSTTAPIWNSFSTRCLKKLRLSFEHLHERRSIQYGYRYCDRFNNLSQSCSSPYYASGKAVSHKLSPLQNAQDSRVVGDSAQPTSPPTLNLAG